MIILCGGTTSISAPPEPATGVVVIGEVFGEDEPGVGVVVFGEVVVGNDSLFEPPVVLSVMLGVAVVFVLLLATSCLNGSPKLCA